MLSVIVNPTSISALFAQLSISSLFVYPTGWDASTSIYITLQKQDVIPVQLPLSPSGKCFQRINKGLVIEGEISTASARNQQRINCGSVDAQQQVNRKQQEVGR